MIVRPIWAAFAAGGWMLAWAAAAPATTTLHAVRVMTCGEEAGRTAAVATGVAISRDGATVAAAGDDHVVRIWDSASGKLRAALEGHRDWVRSVALSPDGQMLASGANDCRVCLWNAATGQRLLAIDELARPVTAVAFHPNNQQLAAAGFGQPLAIINTSTGQITQELDCPSADQRAVAFSPDGERMAVAGRNGLVRLWNVVTGTLERDIPTGRQRVRALAFSPDGSRLASAGDGLTIHVLDLAGGDDIRLAARPAKIYAAVFLDQHTLATGGSDNVIRIWDISSRMVTKELVGHTGSVAALACDEAGATLVSGSYDTTVRIWNVEANESPAVAQSPGEAVR